MANETTIAECRSCGRKYFHVHQPGKNQKCDTCGTLLECGTSSCRLDTSAADLTAGLMSSIRGSSLGAGIVAYRSKPHN